MYIDLYTHTYIYNRKPIRINRVCWSPTSEQISKMYSMYSKMYVAQENYT